MKVNPEEVRPKKRGESDKYSWNLYRYLRDNNKRDIRFCYHTENPVDSKEQDLPLDFNKSFGTMQIFVLFGDGKGGFGTSGIRVSDAMHKGQTARLETFSFCLWDKSKFVDITEQFWNLYRQIGRCVFDRNHHGWWQGEGRFTQINKNSRKCNWCGKHQRRQIKKYVNIERREVWT